MKENFIVFIKEHLALIIGALTGFVIAILFLLIGFFPTMLILLLTGIGAVIGGIPFIRKYISTWFGNLLEKLYNKIG